MPYNVADHSSLRNRGPDPSARAWRTGFREARCFDYVQRESWISESLGSFDCSVGLLDCILLFALPGMEAVY